MLSYATEEIALRYVGNLMTLQVRPVNSNYPQHWRNNRRSTQCHIWVSTMSNPVIIIIISNARSNAVELIVAIIALVKKEVIIVQTSLIGSMLSNLLLVMGMCFFFGGIDRMEQHFNVVVAQTAASLLALAVASLIIPTAFKQWSSGAFSLHLPHTSLSRLFK